MYLFLTVQQWPCKNAKFLEAKLPIAAGSQDDFSILSAGPLYLLVFSSVLPQVLSWYKINAKGVLINSADSIL